MKKCDICGAEAVYDAKLNFAFRGAWAYLCEACFQQHSASATYHTPLGTGVGQRLADVKKKYDEKQSK